MGIPVLSLGESGAGKTASLRNFAPEEIGIFNVASKPLPFRKRMKVVNYATYQRIKERLPQRDGNGRLPNDYLRTYAIDDSQYLLAFEFFDRAKETGYGKFTDIALHFRDLIQFVIAATPPDCIVYFLHHVETDANGSLKAKTIGKMLDEKLTVEGLFSIVLLCRAEKGRHYFLTQSDGFSTAKSPMEMFEAEIDNDLKLVDTTIRSYWGLTKTKEEETGHETV